MIETIGILAAICTTLAFLPQAVKTIRTKNTAGISLMTYVIFCSGIMLWLVYGLMIKNNPIIYSNAITSIFAFIVLVYKISAIRNERQQLKRRKLK